MQLRRCQTFQGRRSDPGLAPAAPAGRRFGKTQSMSVRPPGLDLSFSRSLSSPRTHGRPASFGPSSLHSSVKEDEAENEEEAERMGGTVIEEEGGEEDAGVIPAAASACLPDDKAAASERVAEGAASDEDEDASVSQEEEEPAVKAPASRYSVPPCILRSVGPSRLNQVCLSAQCRDPGDDPGPPGEGDVSTGLSSAGPRMTSLEAAAAAALAAVEQEVESGAEEVLPERPSAALAHSNSSSRHYNPWAPLAGPPSGFHQTLLLGHAHIVRSHVDSMKIRRDET